MHKKGKHIITETGMLNIKQQKKNKLMVSAASLIKFIYIPEHATHKILIMLYQNYLYLIITITLF